MAIPVAVHATRHGCDRRICLPCRACARVAFGRTDGQVLHFDWTGPDLESRIHQRRTELIATLGELKADLRLATTEVRDRMKALAR